MLRSRRSAPRRPGRRGLLAVGLALAVLGLTLIVPAPPTADAAPVSFGNLGSRGLRCSGSRNIELARMKITVNSPNGGNDVAWDVGQKIDLEYTVDDSAIGNAGHGPTGLDWIVYLPPGTQVVGTPTIDIPTPSRYAGQSFVGVSNGPNWNDERIIWTWDDNSEPGFGEQADGISMRLRFSVIVVNPPQVEGRLFYTPGPILATGGTDPTGVDTAVSCSMQAGDPRAVWGSDGFPLSQIGNQSLSCSNTLNLNGAGVVYTTYPRTGEDVALGDEIKLMIQLTNVPSLPADYGNDGPGDLSFDFAAPPGTEITSFRVDDGGSGPFAFRGGDPWGDIGSSFTSSTATVRWDGNSGPDAFTYPDGTSIRVELRLKATAVGTVTIPGLTNFAGTDPTPVPGPIGCADLPAPGLSFDVVTGPPPSPPLSLDDFAFTYAHYPSDATPSPDALASTPHAISVDLLDNDQAGTRVTAVDGGSLAGTLDCDPLPNTTTCTYTPAPDLAEGGTATYSSARGTGEFIERGGATLSVDVLGNEPPEVVDDDAATAVGAAVRIPVLANDHSDDDPGVTLLSVGPATRGTTAVDGDDVVYTPTGDTAGSDTFTYVACDRYAIDGAPARRCATATVSVALALATTSTSSTSTTSTTSTTSSTSTTSTTSTLPPSTTSTTVDPGTATSTTLTPTTSTPTTSTPTTSTPTTARAATAAATTAPGAAAGTLARTGRADGPTAALGSALLVLGVALVLLSRSIQPNRTPTGDRR